MLRTENDTTTNNSKAIAIEIIHCRLNAILKLTVFAKDDVMHDRKEQAIKGIEMIEEFTKEALDSKSLA